MSNIYNDRLYQQESVLTVGAVQIPALIQLNGEDWEGPIVELLRAITRKIPWIKTIKIINEIHIGHLLSTGQVAVDITPHPICIKNGVSQGTAGFGYLAIGGATQFNGTLIYVQSHTSSSCSCPTNPSAACTISSATPSNVLAMLASISPIYLYANDNFAAMSASCGGYTDTDNIITLPTADIPVVPNPATGDSIVKFFDSIQSIGLHVCNAVLYLDEVLTSSQITEINTTGASSEYVFGYITPTSAVFAYVWTFNDYASRLQLWFQFALDQVVASGEYNAIIKAGGLDGSNGYKRRYQQYSSNAPLVLPFRPPPVQYSLKKGFIPRAALYETLLPKLCCYEAKCPVKVLSTEECPEEVAPPSNNGS